MNAASPPAVTRSSRQFPRATIRGMLRQLELEYRSREQVAQSLRVSRKILDKIATEPTHVPHETTEQAIRGAFEKINPRRPYPDYLHLSRDELAIAKANPGSPMLQNVLTRLDGFLTRHTPDSRFDEICARSLHVVVLFSMAFHNGGRAVWFNARECVERAEAIVSAALIAAEDARVEAEKSGDVALANSLHHELLRIDINRIGIMAEASTRKFGISRSELKERLIADHAIERILEFSGMREHAYLWQAPYNGVELSEMLDLPESADQFYDLLVKVDGGFRDPDYDPGEVPPLRSPRSPEDIRKFCGRRFPR